MRNLILLLSGILSASSFCFAGLIPLTNAGLETGDFTGWTQSGNTGFASVTPGSPHSGSYFASFGPIGSLGFISQSVATTPGNTYDVSFYLGGDGSPSEAALYWGGVQVGDWVDVSLGDWALFSVTGLSASSSSTELMFGFRDDPSYLYLDDVAVNENAGAIPEPSSLILCGAGALLVFLRRRKQHSPRMIRRS